MARGPEEAGQAGAWDGGRKAARCLLGQELPGARSRGPREGRGGRQGLYLSLGGQGPSCLTSAAGRALAGAAGAISARQGWAGGGDKRQRGASPRLRGDTSPPTAPAAPGPGVHPAPPTPFPVPSLVGGRAGGERVRAAPGTHTHTHPPTGGCGPGVRAAVRSRRRGGRAGARRCRRGGGERGGAERNGAGARLAAAGGGAVARSGPGPAGPGAGEWARAPGAWAAAPVRRLRGWRGRGRSGAALSRGRASPATPGHCPGTARACPSPRGCNSPCVSPCIPLQYAPPPPHCRCIAPHSPLPPPLPRDRSQQPTAFLSLRRHCPPCPSAPPGARVALGDPLQCYPPHPPQPRALGIARPCKRILPWCSCPSPCKAVPACMRGCVCVACSTSCVSVSGGACPCPQECPSLLGRAILPRVPPCSRTRQPILRPCSNPSSLRSR